MQLGRERNGSFFESSTKTEQSALGPISAVRRFSVGHFFQSYRTKEIPMVKRQIGNPGQFGSGVGGPLVHRD